MNEYATGAIKRLSYAESVNAALKRSLSERQEVLVYGEDVGKPGGVFGVTKGLHKEFGGRVFDTPISESAILGSAVGASMVGMRPVVEIMWSDFTLVALDQIVNQAANVRYLTRGKLSAPITIRMQQGNGPGACAQHSQCLEAIFAHIPGIQVGMPSTRQDAYDMTLSAINTNDPTIIIENRNLYHNGKEDVLIDTPIQKIGGPVVRKNGQDVTVVTWGMMQEKVIAAADRVTAAGVSAEVIDLRWLRPLDLTPVIESLRKTRSLLIIHEAHTFGGFGAEVLSAVVETGIELRRTPRRIGTPPVRIPAAVSLAEAVIPSIELIEQEIILAGGK